MGKSVNRWLYKDSKYSYQLKDLTSRKSIHEIKENLKGMGLYGGHTIMSHCGVPIDGLRHRLVGENADAFESTSYQSYDDCINAIAYGLYETWDTEIIPWLKNERGTKFLTINCKLPDDIVGYGVCSTDMDTLIYCYTQCIVLKRSKKNKWGFRITTAFPTYKSINQIMRFEKMRQ